MFNFETVCDRMRKSTAEKPGDKFEHERHQMGRVTFGDSSPYRHNSINIHAGSSGDYWQ